QESTQREKVRSFTLTQEGPMSVMPPTFNMMFQRDRMPEGEISFFSAEMAGAGETVTAAPYSATATTESTQVLGDGNRIVNKTSAFVAPHNPGPHSGDGDLQRV